MSTIPISTMLAAILVFLSSIPLLLFYERQCYTGSMWLSHTAPDIQPSRSVVVNRHIQMIRFWRRNKMARALYILQSQFILRLYRARTPFRHVSIPKVTVLLPCLNEYFVATRYENFASPNRNVIQGVIPRRKLEGFRRCDGSTRSVEGNLVGVCCRPKTAVFPF